jgi:WD40 repeat protein
MDSGLLRWHGRRYQYMGHQQRQRDRPLRYQPDQCQEIVFSPGRPAPGGDGPDPTLRLLDVETGEETLLIDNLSETHVSNVIFSPDGKRLAVTSQDGSRSSWWNWRISSSWPNPG